MLPQQTVPVQLAGMRKIAAEIQGKLGELERKVGSVEATLGIRQAAPQPGLVIAGAPVAVKRRKKHRAKGPATKWVADGKAKRVPNFVIQSTGLKTKAGIIAKFGEGATFQAGQPMPQALTGRVEKAKKAA